MGSLGSRYWSGEKKHGCLFEVDRKSKAIPEKHDSI